MIKCCDVLRCLSVLALIGLAFTSPLHQDRCHHVRKSYGEFVYKHDHHSHAIKDICGHQPASCCAGLEVAIETKTRRHFAAQVKSHLESFRIQFKQREQRIHYRLNSALNETADRINQIYPGRIAIANANLLNVVRQNMFARNQHLISIDLHLEKLFSAIVISELEKSQEAKRIEPEYSDCLSNVKFSDFFIEISRNLSSNFRIAVETTRLILQSLQLTSQLLNRTEEVKLSEDCVRHLAQDQQCEACLDHGTSTRLCQSSCRAIIAHCTSSSQLGRIDRAWRNMSDSLTQFVDSMVENRNPETILNTYPALIEATKEQARTKNEIVKKARVSCGPINIKLISPSNSLDDSLDHPRETYSAYSESLFVSFESMAHLLSRHKDLVVSLPQAFCQQHPDKDCLDSRSSISIGSAQAQPLSTESGNYQDDEIYYLVKGFQKSVQINHNRTAVHLLEDDDSSLRSDEEASGDVEGSAHHPLYPDTENEGCDDDEESSGGGACPPESTSISSSTTNDINFFDSSTSPPTSHVTESSNDGTGSSSWSLEPCNSLLIALVVFIWSLGRRPCC